ncbi:multiple sugar transport system substrate-binding protein [Evansella caseinilytica]|uniref:Multiple sugar transport system substrate-binding protein n=1 Tax=Evansella caseinilytica TaxID=1503961 RepID=A0A1H3TE58_9BACI|nr:extracellular solute-binding protein [Evansella caseinilytica]SDZ48158.1 multiple sugar transport system substrate-binding protein [Evansella caseinilytica]
MRRKLSFILLSAIFFLLIAAGCSDETANEPENGEGESDNVSDEKAAAPELEAMTTEEITLSYASWANHTLNEFLAEKFMEKYPNITVEIVQLEQDGWNDHLTNLASTGDLPDVYWYMGNVDIPIRNGWLGDITAYFESDPESDDILVTMKDAGYFDGEQKLAAPAAYQPYTIYLDENLFNQLNVDMPSADWTYGEMIDLMQEMTVPEQGIYGYNTFTKLVTMAPIVNQDAYGEFGWDGEQYDLTTDWADSMNQHAEYVRSGVHAPFYDTDEAEAAFGDRLLWAASTGRIAMQLDAWWTMGLFAEPEFVDKGMKWVPYPVPQGDNAQSQHKPAFIDFGAISSATEHPREAYELLKFFGWGKDGWTAKLEAFEALENEDGSLMFKHPDGLPLINDEEIWNGLQELLPQSEYVSNFLERVKEPIALGGASHPGFQTFLDEVYFGGEYGDVEAAIINGEVNAYDISQNLTDMINQYREEALEELFW